MPAALAEPTTKAKSASADLDSLTVEELIEHEGKLRAELTDLRERIRVRLHGLLVSRSRFSRREEQVYEFVLKGLTNKEIAYELNLSERTIKFHVSAILAKSGCRDRTDLLRPRI